MTDEVSKKEGGAKFALPIIFWTTDSVFRSYKINVSWTFSKADVRQMNAYCKIMRILDASGKCFSIGRWEEVPPTNKIAAFFRKWSWESRFVPIITSEKQLDLETFKKEIKRAVTSRQRHDFDSNILAETMEKLPNAKTYLEAIESLPKLI
jgi:hypothetical protein